MIFEYHKHKCLSKMAETIVNGWSVELGNGSKITISRTSKIEDVRRALENFEKMFPGIFDPKSWDGTTDFSCNTDLYSEGKYYSITIYCVTLKYRDGEFWSIESFNHTLLTE